MNKRQRKKNAKKYDPQWSKKHLRKAKSYNRPIISINGDVLYGFKLVLPEKALKVWG